MAGQFPRAAVLSNGADADLRWRRNDTAENGGVRDIGRIATGAKANETHRDRRARGVKNIPAPIEEDFDISMEIGRPEQRIGAVIDTRGKAGRNTQGAAEGDHQVREITADTDAVGQRIERRGGRVAGVALEGDIAAHPVLDGFDPTIALGQQAELAHGEHAEAVGLAIAARIDVVQNRKGQLGDLRFSDLIWIADMVLDIDRGLIGYMQWAGGAGQAQIAGAAGRIVGSRGQYLLADVQLFADNGLRMGCRGMDIEDKISAGISQFVVKVDCELDANHVFPKWCRHGARIEFGALGRAVKQRFATGK